MILSDHFCCPQSLSDFFSVFLIFLLVCSMVVNHCFTISEYWTISQFFVPHLEDIAIRDMWFQQEDTSYYIARKTLRVLLEFFSDLSSRILMTKIGRRDLVLPLSTYGFILWDCLNSQVRTNNKSMSAETWKYRHIYAYANKIVETTTYQMFCSINTSQMSIFENSHLANILKQLTR